MVRAVSSRSIRGDALAMLLQHIAIKFYDFILS